MTVMNNPMGFLIRYSARCPFSFQRQFNTDYYLCITIKKKTKPAGWCSGEKI